MLIMDIVVVEIVLFFILLSVQWFRGRKSAATNWPFIGMAPTLLCNLSHIHDHSTWLIKKGGGTFHGIGAWFCNFNFVLTGDPMNFNHILSKNFPNYPKGRGFMDAFDHFGEGILNSDSDMWKFQRNILHSTIKNKKFELYVENITWQKVETSLIPILDHFSTLGSEVDLQNLFGKLTMDTSCMFVLGIDPCCLSADFREVSLHKAFDRVGTAGFYRNVFPEIVWKSLRWLNIGLERGRSQDIKILDTFLYECILKRKEKMDNYVPRTRETRFDILTILTSGEEYISSIDNPGKFLKDIAYNMIFAGKLGLASGLSWFFWFVATNPIVEEQILDEMKKNLDIKPGEKWRFQNTEELNKLVYFHGAICETLRLYPPVPFNRKTATEADILPSGHRVKANMMVLLSLYSMGRMEEVWGKDCLEFKPERWISETGGVVHVPSYKFAPFSSGPRTCLGKNPSFIAMKIVATSIIWNYKIRCVEGHPVVPLNSIVLNMKHGLNITVSKRRV